MNGFLSRSLWLLLACIALSFARAIDHGSVQLQPDFWARVASQVLSALCWFAFVIGVVKWLGK